jgi:hypothetical protein
MALQIAASKNLLCNQFPLAYKDYERAKLATKTYNWIELARNKYEIYYCTTDKDYGYLEAYTSVNEPEIRIVNDALMLETKSELIEMVENYKKGYRNEFWCDEMVYKPNYNFTLDFKELTKEWVEKAENYEKNFGNLRRIFLQCG